MEKCKKMHYKEEERHMQDREKKNEIMVNRWTKTCPDKHPSTAINHHTGWEGLEPNRPGRQYEKRPKAENT